MFNILFLKNISEGPLWKEQIKSRMALRDINQKVWKEENLFTPVWWLMIISIIVLWITWWKLVDKTRLLEIVTYGLMISIVSIILDIAATELVVWGYPNRLTPLSPPLMFIDLCLLPVIFMLIYQYFTNWKRFLTALLISAFLLAFVIEPLAVWLDVFQMNNWKYVYSFPVYIVMASVLKWIVDKIKSKQGKVL